jgi:hypothetical protein
VQTVERGALASVNMLLDDGGEDAFRRENERMVTCARVSDHYFV